MKPSTSLVGVDRTALSTLLAVALLVDALLLANLAAAAQQAEISSPAASKGDASLCASSAKDKGKTTISASSGRGEALTAPSTAAAATKARRALSTPNRAAPAAGAIADADIAATAHSALVAAPSALELSITSYGKTSPTRADSLSSSRGPGGKGGVEGGVEGSGSKKSAAVAAAAAAVASDPLQTAAGHHHHHGGHHGKYYMYAEVPKKHAYKMGFRRGNHKHMIERKESVHKSHVHSYFKWHDKKGKGSHKFEFKHHDKKKGHH